MHGMPVQPISEGMPILKVIRVSASQSRAHLLFFTQGHLNDITGTYAWSMRLGGLWLLLGALVFFLEFPLRRAFIPADSSSAISKLSNNSLKQGKRADGDCISGSSSPKEIPKRSPWCRHLPENASIVIVSVDDLSTGDGGIPVTALPGLTESTIPFVGESGEMLTPRK